MNSLGAKDRPGRLWRLFKLSAQSKLWYKSSVGALAQLVARFNGIEEVTSSNLVRSTNIFSSGKNARKV